MSRADLWAHAGGSGVRLNDGPDLKLFILVGWDRSFFVCCLAHRGSTHSEETEYWHLYRYEPIFPVRLIGKDTIIN